HRDLKPGNVFLLAEGAGAVAKVLDFGIAKLGVESMTQDGQPMTLSGVALGTVIYMSPEQIENAQRVDHRADLWSIAVMTYECLTGVRPFRANSLVELIREVCFGTPVPASKLAVVPRGFDAWFERAVNHNLQRRFASAEELLEALRALDPASAPAGQTEDAKVKPERQGPKARSERPADPALPLESWASDANQIDIRLLKELTFKNAVVHEFLDSGNKHFVSGSKGLGKTLLLTYKRSLLSDQYQAGTGKGQAAVKFVPEGRPYLDLMGDLPSLRQATIDLLTSLERCKRLWGFALRLSALSHHPALLQRGDEEILARLPPQLRVIAEGRQAEPTMIAKELLALPPKQINQVIDGCENFLEHKIRSLHSAMFVFIDKLDQALRQLPRAAWVHMQAGMIEAAWDLMN
ncbi:MAG: protein kinase, partial [Myxococcales bacterium]|nr:protein kinase [Myxococcales bacterium]